MSFLSSFLARTHGMPTAIATSLAFVVLSTAWCAAQSTDAPQSSSRETKKQPNVVLIISDDQSWTDYGFMEHPHLSTPRLDQLARESAVFPRGYVPTALCRPSLATIITGLYAHQHGITGNDPGLPDDAPPRYRSSAEYRGLRDKLIAKIDAVPTLPRLLGEQGYASFQCGKWWEGNYTRGGFTAGMTHGDPSRGGRHGDQGLKIGRQGMQPVLDFITRSKDQPFFVWYAPFLPHTPHNPPERLLAKYRRPDRPIALARYWAMCEWFDETCGELLDHVDKTGLRDNTLVVYVTDNGWIQRTPQTKTPAGWRQSYAPRSKQSPNEGGIRTPIMLRWPGVIAPGNHDALASSIDIAPTVLEACGLESPASLPGVSLLGASAGKPLKREAIFGEGFAHDVANLDQPADSLLYRWCIDGRWKLLLNYDGKLGRYRASHLPRVWEPQLFDLLEDPHEERNVAKEHPEIAAKLSKRISGWWDAGRDPGQND